MPLTPEQIAKMNELTGLQPATSTSKKGASRFAELQALSGQKPSIRQSFNEALLTPKQETPMSDFMGANVAKTAVDYGTEMVKNPAETVKGVAKGVPGGAAQFTKLIDTGVNKALGNEGTTLDYSAIEELTQPSNKAQQGGYVVGTALPVERAVSASTPLVKAGVEAVETGLKGGAEAVGNVASKTSEIVSDVYGGAKTLGKDILEPVVKAPQRLATNVAEKQAAQAEIQALPTPQARNVVQEGVDVADARDIINITERTKSPKLKELVTTVEKFADGDKSTDPIEIVGKPIIEKLKQTEKLKASVGKELGEVAKNLGIVTKPELENSVFARLKEISGLSGLTVKNGKLNFNGTTLTSKATASDRKAIQEAYTKATEWGDGRKAHLYRQELFEILGGKKRAMENITSTQEEALNAVRRGLADVLDTKNPKYKELSQKYAQITSPLEEMRKLMKGVAPDDPEDILNLSAGILGRRITSTAPSNSKVRSILRSLDEVVDSDTLGNVEALQDMYNILNKYYDIAPRTGFQNLTKEALDSSMVSKITGKVGEYIGKTDATRQKALKEFLESTFENYFSYQKWFLKKIK